MSTTTLNIITPTTMITNHNSQLCTDVILNSNERIAMKTTNVNDGRQNEREEKEKGEREQTMRERIIHTNKNTDLVISSPSPNEQDNSSMNSYTMSNHYYSLLSYNTYDIINEEILEIIYLDHYPTLIERWGDDTKVMIEAQGEYLIEIFYEFDEIEPTKHEEISYQYIYSNGKIISTKEIYHSYYETRNFRKIKKQRISRKHLSGVNKIYHNNAIQSSNIDLITSKDIKEQSSKSDEQKNDLLEHRYTILNQINQSHISSNDIDSRLEPSINQTHDKHIELSKRESVEIPIHAKFTEDESTIVPIIDENNHSSIEKDTDLKSFLNSLLTHLIADSFDENKQSTFDTDSQHSIPSSQLINNDQHELSNENVQITIPSAELTLPQSESTKIIEEPISIDSLTELVHQIRTTIVTPSEKDEPIREKLEELPVNDLENNIVENSYQDDDEQSESNSINSITSESLQQSIEETTSSSNDSLILPVNLRLPDNEIKTNEKSITDLSDEIDKQSESIANPTTTTTITQDEELSQQTYDNENELVPTKFDIETPEITTIANEKQSSIPLNTKDHDNVADSSDFLVDIVRQITDTSSTFHSPSVAKLTETPLTDITQHTNNTSIPTTDDKDNQLLKSNEIISTTTPANQFIPTVTDIHVQNDTNSSISNQFEFNSIYQTSPLISTINDQQSNKKKITPDYTKLYYELKEQRHIQPILNNILTEEKQQTSDVNIKQLDIKSFSSISNLPSQEYHQVFGVPVEIINTVNDLTYSVDQTLQLADSNEKSTIIETSEDDSSIVSTDQIKTSDTSNNELDFRYTSLLDRISILIKPLINLTSSPDIVQSKSIVSNTEEDNNETIKSNDEILIPTETDSEILNSKSSEETTTKVVDEQQQEPLSTKLFEIVKNLLPSAISLEKTSDDIEQQEPRTEDQHSLQLSTTNGEEHHSLLDRVIDAASNIKDTILNLGSSDESMDQKQSTDSTIHQSSIVEQESQNTVETKPKYQPLQVLNDEYPWYTSHYNIIDAETKMTQLYKQLNLFNTQSPTTTVSEEETSEQKHEAEPERKKDDDDGFRTVQRRKRILSSTITTIQEKTMPTTTITSPTTLSPDIDLKPVILHGHPDVVIPVTPIVVPSTTKANTKKKHKRKNKDKQEMILFDAPEPISLDNNKQNMDTVQHPTTIDVDSSASVEQTSDEQVEQTHSIPTIIDDDQKSENLTTSIIDNTDELTQIDEKDKEEILSNPPQMPPVQVTTLPKEVEVNNEALEQEPTNTKQILPSAPSTTKTIRTKEITSSKVDDEEEDDEGFQLVQYRKRILSTPKSDQTPPLTPVSKDDFDSNMAQKSSTILEDNTQSSTIKKKKKRNKHKKHKNEPDAASDIEPEKPLESNMTSPLPIIKDKDVQATSILPPISNITTTNTKPFPSPKQAEQKEEEDDDDDGFQVVTHRKRITSAPRSTNIPSTSSSSLVKTKYEQNIRRNIDQKPVVPPGRHGSASPSIPRPNQRTVIPPKQNKKQISMSSIPSRPIPIETKAVISTDSDNSIVTSKDIQQTPNENQQELKDSKYEPILNKTPTVDQSISRESEVVNTNEEITTKEHVVVVPRTTSNDIDTVIETPTLKEDDNNKTDHKDVPPLTTAIVSEQPTLNSINIESSVPATIDKKKSKKRKKPNDITSLSLTTDIDATPLSVEETIDNNNPSLPHQTSLINSTYDDSITTSMTEPTSQTDDDSQSPLHSIKSTASSTTAVEEIPLPANELPVLPPPVESTNNNLQSPTTNETENKLIKEEKSLEQTTHIHDEPATITTTTAAKKPAKRRKQKTHAKEKSDDETLVTSPTNATVTTNHVSNDTVKESNTNTIENSKSITIPATDPSNEINNKLDLFLPEYIRQQINSSSTNSSPLPSPSYDINQKKKQRPKMLNKDSEAQSLLTNEYDTITNHTDKQSTTQQISSSSEEQNLDNVLSRGFFLWLQGSQAISQQSSNIMQSIVIQPEHDDDHEDSSKTIQSTSMFGTLTNKKIHTTNAYYINHPESLSTPSWLINQSNDRTFQDHQGKSHSNNKDQGPRDNRSSKQTNTQSNNYQHQQQNHSPKDDLHNLPINFDDWAHFIEQKNSYHIGNDLATSLECFYTQIYDDDTLISDEIPLKHSIQNKQQRYGDFSLLSASSSSNNAESSQTKFPLHKSKPSKFFQNWRKQETKSTDDNDEIIISHSNDGFSRQSNNIYDNFELHVGYTYDSFYQTTSLNR